MRQRLQPESAAPMVLVASTEFSPATPPLRNYRGRARGALVRMLPQRARKSPLRARAGHRRSHCKTAMAVFPRILLLGAPATAHLPCPCDIPILPRPGLQPDEARGPSSVPVWGRLLPQEPGALAPTRARPGPSRLVCDWSASVARPRVAGAFQAVLASVIMSMRATGSEQRDGGAEEEGGSRSQEAVVGISGVVLVVLDSTFLDG